MIFFFFFFILLSYLPLQLLVCLFVSSHFFFFVYLFVYLSTCIFFSSIAVLRTVFPCLFTKSVPMIINLPSGLSHMIGPPESPPHTSSVLPSAHMYGKCRLSSNRNGAFRERVRNNSFQPIRSENHAINLLYYLINNLKQIA